MQPIGPEASSVYWVRRAAFLVIVLIVLFGLIGIIRAVAGGGSEGPAVVEPAVSQAPSVDPTTVLTPVSTEPIACVDSAIFVEVDHGLIHLQGR